LSWAGDADADGDAGADIGNSSGPSTSRISLHSPCQTVRVAQDGAPAQWKSLHRCPPLSRAIYVLSHKNLTAFVLRE